MSANSIYNQIHIFLAVIGSGLASLIGGFDALFQFTLILVLVDVVTGFIGAWENKEISSKVLRRGLINKCFFIVFVWIGMLADKVMVQVTGNTIHILGKEYLLRNIVLCYIILEELISVLENACIMGIPVPKWLRSVLKQVSETVNTSTPKFVSDFIHEKLGIDITDNGSEETNKENTNIDNTNEE